MRNKEYLLAGSANPKAILHQWDFIGASLKANVKHRAFVKLESIYGEYFP